LCFELLAQDRISALSPARQRFVSELAHLVDQKRFHLVGAANPSRLRRLFRQLCYRQQALCQLRFSRQCLDQITQVSIIVSWWFFSVHPNPISET